MSSIAPFVRKAFQLVSDSKSNQIVSWSVDGNSFIIWKSQDFEKVVLPQYFKHNNICSFIRQLNTYGFRKINSETSDGLEFVHPSFQQNKKNLLRKICRKSSKKAITPQLKSNQSSVCSQSKVAQTLFALVARQQESEKQLAAVLKELEETRNVLRAFKEPAQQHNHQQQSKRSFNEAFSTAAPIQPVKKSKTQLSEVDIVLNDVCALPLTFDDLFRESATPNPCYSEAYPMYDTHAPALDDLFMPLM